MNPEANKANDRALAIVEPAAVELMPHWRDVLAAYLQTLNSERTRRVYRRAVEQAMRELGPLHALAPTHLTAWRERLTARLAAEHAPLSSASVALQLAALRGYLRFARLTGQLAMSNEVITFCLKSPSAKVVKPYQVLGDEEQRRLLSVAAGRDRALLALLLGTGLRIAEACGLKVGDLQTDEEGDWLLRVRMGKGRRDRLVPLPLHTTAELRAYLAARSLRLGDKQDAGAWLFPSRQGAHISTERARQLLRRYCALAGVNDKAISPHSLRHTYAISLLRDGAPVGAVQKLLGHASLSTTQRYTDHLELGELKRAVQRRGAID